MKSGLFMVCIGAACAYTAGAAVRLGYFSLSLVLSLVAAFPLGIAAARADGAK